MQSQEYMQSQKNPMNNEYKDKGNYIFRREFIILRSYT